MSSYANFMVRDPKTKRFLPIAAYSRSSAIYEYCEEYLPFEKVRALDEALINAIIHDIESEDSHYNECIAREQTKLDLIPKMEGSSVSEKVDAIAEVQNSIKDYNELHEELMEAKMFFVMLLRLVDEGKYIDENDNKEPYVYAGIEIGEKWLNEHQEEVE